MLGSRSSSGFTTHLSCEYEHFHCVPGALGNILLRYLEHKMQTTWDPQWKGLVLHYMNGI